MTITELSGLLDIVSCDACVPWRSVEERNGC